MDRVAKGRRPLTDDEVEVVRERILVAARELFAKEGYSSVSMRALAEATGMSAMALYRYYENKRAILIQLWAEIYLGVFDTCRSAAEAATTPAAAVKAYATSFVGYWIDNPDNYMMVYGEIDTPVGGESFFTDSDTVAAEIAYITGLLAKAGVPEEDLQLTLQQMICAMHGVCHSLITIPEFRWDSRQALISGLVDGLLRLKAI